ncbi:MAG: replication protein [Bacteroidia bacterium]
MNKGFTQVPNEIFDTHLPNLTLAELKLLLVVIRQTIGWVYKKSGKRKIRDRVSHEHFIRKTNLSRKIISKSLQSLVTKGLIIISDYRGNILEIPYKRKGRSYLYYSFSCLQPVHFKTGTCANSAIRPVQKSLYNKINYTKETETKETVKSIAEIIQFYNSKGKS